MEGAKFSLEDQLDRHKYPIASASCGREGVSLQGLRVWGESLAQDDIAQGSQERGQTETRERSSHLWGQQCELLPDKETIDN